MAASQRSLADILGSSPDRRTDLATRKTVAQMSPEERAQALLTSDKTGLPNRRAFDEAQPPKAVAMSDADGLKALNDKFGYEAGDALLKAKADALKEAGLDAYHEKGDEFLYRGDSPADIQAKLEQARNILRNKTITVEMNDGRVLQFKGADFSYGTGKDLPTAESGLKANKAQREASGERARGELRGITEVGPEAGQENIGGAAQADISGNNRQNKQSPVAIPSLMTILTGKRPSKK
jgi:GGDEF domain-containing protein